MPIMSNNRKFGRNELVIASWEEATNRIAFEFAYRYYNTQDCDWIGDQIGGVFLVNDDLWNFDQILQATKLSPSKRQLFDWYDYMITNEFPMNLKSFLALKKKKG